MESQRVWWMGLLLQVFLVFLQDECEAFQSVWSVKVGQDHGALSNIFPNYMFKGSPVTLSIYCYAAVPTSVNVMWSLQQVHCMEQMYQANIKENTDIARLEQQARQEQPPSKKKMLPAEEETVMTTTTTNQTPNLTASVDQHMREKRSAKEENVSSEVHPSSGDVRPPMAFQASYNKTYHCGDHNIIALDDESQMPYRRVSFPKGDAEPVVLTVERKDEHSSTMKYRVVTVWESGMYHFQLTVIPVNMNQTFEGQVRVEMHGNHGYLSAIDWPLLPFNGVMSFLYLILSTAWIMTWARSHRYTLKIHVAMGLTAVGGAMSHTLVFVQNASENSNGGGIPLIMWFAQLLAVIQVAFLTFTLMVISTGYGISVPSLPFKVLVKMGAVSGLQFGLGVTWIVLKDADLRLQYSYPTLTKVTLGLKIATYIFIAGWIMVSAIRTLIHLRQRQHAGTKVITFTIFMASCIVAFLLQLSVFGVSMGWMQACRTKWQLQWVFDSIPHMEAFLLLIVLMILWRPVDTDQSYAFAPLGMEALADGSEEEGSEDEVYSKESEKFKLEPL